MMPMVCKTLFPTVVATMRPSFQAKFGNEKVTDPYL